MIPARIQYLFGTWVRWRKRKRERLMYRNEVAHLRRELIAVYSGTETLEMLFREKQAKINRLLKVIPKRKAIGLHPADLMEETIITTTEDMCRQMSEDFDWRMQEYERTGVLSPPGTTRTLEGVHEQAN